MSAKFKLGDEVILKRVVFNTMKDFISKEFKITDIFNNVGNNLYSYTIVNKLVTFVVPEGCLELKETNENTFKKVLRFKIGDIVITKSTNLLFKIIEIFDDAEENDYNDYKCISQDERNTYIIYLNDKDIEGLGQKPITSLAFKNKLIKIGDKIEFIKDGGYGHNFNTFILKGSSGTVIAVRKNIKLDKSLLIVEFEKLSTTDNKNLCINSFDFSIKNEFDCVENFDNLINTFKCVHIFDDDFNSFEVVNNESQIISEENKIFVKRKKIINTVLIPEKRKQLFFTDEQWEDCYE